MTIGRMVLQRRNLQVVEWFDEQRLRASRVIVGITVHNRSPLLRRCLKSIAEQTCPCAVVLLDDGSNGDWQNEFPAALGGIPAVAIAANCGNPARARNAILDFVDAELPEARWIARLDADDRFSDVTSLGAAVDLGDRLGARFVLGGNRLVLGGELLSRSNPATDSLLDTSHVVDLLNSMARGDAENELPSCNLLLRTGFNKRYPDCVSAEDHRLVARLLILEKEHGAILKEPFFCDYSLNGAVSFSNREDYAYRRSRAKLAGAAREWKDDASSRTGLLLGMGNEGVVHKFGPFVTKRFFPKAIDEQQVALLQNLLPGTSGSVPSPSWVCRDACWEATYAHFDSEPVSSINELEALAFLSWCLEHGIVCRDIKRANFRRRLAGGLVFIDIGPDIVPMNVDYFRDSAARLFGISKLQYSDDELRRRPVRGPKPALEEVVPGFDEFYRRLMSEHAQATWSQSMIDPPMVLPPANDVTLLIKACAMDAGYVETQVTHIVQQLSKPRGFAERVLAIDPHEGMFLRQHSNGSLAELRQAARALHCKGLVDRIIESPADAENVRSHLLRWFGKECDKTHTSNGIPLFPQVWAFEQVSTRYVLQCDVDILAGRRDLNHNFLDEMLDVLRKDGILSVGFNIPHSASAPPTPYHAPPGEFVPEVRCGLLDLQRIRDLLPLPNTLDGRHLQLSWYRSLQQRQRETGRRSLRGGDSRSFYVHPANRWKSGEQSLETARDLIGQGRVPREQNGKWDLEGPASLWCHDPRTESVVFLIKGRNTPEARVRRCAQSLAMQRDQDFGVIVIDDGSDESDSTVLPHYFRWLGDRVTIIRHTRRQGRIPNFMVAVENVCTLCSTLVAVLDLDDALLSPDVSRRLSASVRDGHDLVLGAMFRPDKPLKLYHPDFSEPRSKWGGEVWIHLRAFQKALFEAVPDDYFKQADGSWIEECTDYATMLPMAELARSPVYLPEYLYYHERSTPRTPESRTLKDEVIRWILSKAKLSLIGASEQLL